MNQNRRDFTYWMLAGLVVVLVIFYRLGWIGGAS
jgi:hypothetical protein